MRFQKHIQIRVDKALCSNDQLPARVGKFDNGKILAFDKYSQMERSHWVSNGSNCVVMRYREFKKLGLFY